MVNASLKFAAQILQEEKKTNNKAFRRLTDNYEIQVPEEKVPLDVALRDAQTLKNDEDLVSELKALRPVPQEILLMLETSGEVISEKPEVHNPKHFVSQGDY